MFHIKYLFVIKECDVLYIYFNSTFLEQIMRFSMFDQQVFGPCISSGDEDLGLDQLYRTLINDQY